MYRKIIVPENTRAVVTRNGRFVRLLTPGIHRVFSIPMLKVRVELHELRRPLFKSKWAPFLLAKRPDLVAQHFVMVETGPLEVALVSVNGALYRVLWPGKTEVFWKDAGRITCEVVSVAVEYDAPSLLFSSLEAPIVSRVFDENVDDWIYETQEEP